MAAILEAPAMAVNRRLARRRCPAAHWWRTQEAWRRSSRLPSEEEVREVVRRVVAATHVPGPTTSTPAEASSAGEPATGGTAVALGADHGGYELKGRIADRLRTGGYLVHDCGTGSAESVDYPDFAHAVARLVADGTCRWGIVVDGAGIGSCMTANKVPGIRAALCYDVSSARNSREHNHANVLTLGARLVGEGLAMEIVDTWLATPWGAGRHAARVDKITAIERGYLKDGADDRRPG
jgi:ribose 5-phosphate isomerase B